MRDRGGYWKEMNEEAKNDERDGIMTAVHTHLNGGTDSQLKQCPKETEAIEVDKEKPRRKQQHVHLDRHCHTAATTTDFSHQHGFTIDILATICSRDSKARRQCKANTSVVVSP